MSKVLAVAEIEQDTEKSKMLVGTYDLTGLSLTWDDISILRARMRQSISLVAHYDPKFKKLSNHEPERSVANVKANACVLSPLCRVIRSHDGQLPHIDKLAEEIRRFYAISDQSVGLDRAGKEAWSIRHLLGVLKHTTRFERKIGFRVSGKRSFFYSRRWMSVRHRALEL